MKKKMLLFIAFCAITAGSMLEARRWGGHHRGGHHRGHRGYGRGYGWGFGPSFAVSVPVGGGGPRRPGSVKQFERVHGYYPNSGRQFCSWAKDYFTQGKAEKECNRYENWVSGRDGGYRRPAGYLSFGVGGGRGYGYGRRGWW